MKRGKTLNEIAGVILGIVDALGGFGLIVVEFVLMGAFFRETGYQDKAQSAVTKGDRYLLESQTPDRRSVNTRAQSLRTSMPAEYSGWTRSEPPKFMCESV